MIPVFNGAKTIENTVGSILQQSLRPFEIIVVDDGSTDNTSNALKKFESQIVYLLKQNGGPSSARNLGVKSAGGDYVAFTDSDCLPDRDWLLYLMRGFDEPAVGGVGGIIRSADANLTGEYIDIIRLLDPQADETGEIPYVITANACFRREAIIRAGLFDERFRKPGGEEAELCFRIKDLGYQFKFVAEATVFHHHRQSAVSLLKTLASYGEGAYLIGQIRPLRQITNPLRLLLRRLISLKFVIRRLLGHTSRYGARKAIYFSLLDYLRQPAFLWGYLRGQRRDA